MIIDYVTVEDCLSKIKSRFELIIISAKRAHNLMLISDNNIKKNKNFHKPTVLALREISEGKIDYTL